MIESYDFGRIVVDGVTYTSDLIIMRERVEANWWRREGHTLQASDIMANVERFAPELMIVGMGYMGMMKVAKQTREYFEAKRIEFLAEKTEKAYELFNVFSRSKRTMAALHLTC